MLSQKISAMHHELSRYRDTGLKLNGAGIAIILNELETMKRDALSLERYAVRPLPVGLEDGETPDGIVRLSDFRKPSMCQLSSFHMGPGPEDQAS